jgi:hypothetical protein
MIKNFKIKDENGIKSEYQEQIQTELLTENQDELRAVIGESLLLSHLEHRQNFNEVRWKTDDLGVEIETSALLATPHIMRFSDEEVKGDRARNTTGGWYFEASVPGVYRISWNAKFTLWAIDEYNDLIIFNSYLPLIEPCTVGIYRNGTAINPLPELQWTAFDPVNTETSIMTNTDSFYSTIGNQSIIYYLDAGDRIDIRVNFLEYIGIQTIKAGYFGDVNINLISDNRENFNRI